MFDKLEEILNNLFPSFDKYGNQRGPLENYIVGSNIHIVGLVINALLLTSVLMFGNPNTTIYTVSIAIIASSTMIILCSWANAIASIKSHRKNADYHREYMRKI